MHQDTFIDNLPCAAYICDYKGRILYFNNAAEKLWGQKPVLNQDFDYQLLQFFTSDNFPEPDNTSLATAVAQGNESVQKQVTVELTDGTHHTMTAIIMYKAKTNTQDAGAVIMLIDRPDKRNTAEDTSHNENKSGSLKQSEQRYLKMTEEVQDYAILLLDVHGNIQNWNKGAQNIKGYTEKEIIGKNFRLFYLPHDRAGKLPEKLINEAYYKGRAVHEGWRLRKDGTEFWGLVVITALHDNDNNVIGFSKVTRDLTERKKAEDQMKSYLKDIELRNKQLEEYAYIASHDLQEPLRKIQVFSELLEYSIGNDVAVKNNLDKINGCARRMTRLIKDVLAYSQLSASDELYSETDLNRILENIKEDYELLLRDKNVQLIHPVLPLVTGIPIQLHQLFSNLIGNAIKFSTEHPVIEITAENITTEESYKYPDCIPQNYLKLVFKDNGVGFDQQYGDQVFKMFKRLSDNEGTGIGLALCKKITENHNGCIYVESQPGTGTAFTILLPYNN